MGRVVAHLSKKCEMGLDYVMWSRVKGLLDFLIDETDCKVSLERLRRIGYQDVKRDKKRNTVGGRRKPMVEFRMKEQAVLEELSKKTELKLRALRRAEMTRRDQHRTDPDSPGH